MAQPPNRPAYGAWPSPIDARLAAGNDGRPEWPHLTDDDVLWWCEPRPDEGGRTALRRRRADGEVETVLPPPWNLRSRLHEYGGRPWLLTPDGTVVFVHHTDQRLYSLTEGGTPVPLTPAPDRPSGWRYAEPVAAPTGDEVWCVREHLHGDSPTEVTRSLVAVPLDGGAATEPDAVRTLVGDRRFLAGPQVSPDGSTLAWIGWDHPAMPWDATELRVADIAADGTIGPARTLAGGAGESVVQSFWLDAGTLAIVSDPDGWWNLRRVDLRSGRVDDLCPRHEEFGGPLWKTGARWAVPLDDGRILTLHGVGRLRASVLDPATGELAQIDTPHEEWAAHLAASGSRVVGVAGGAHTPWELVEVDLDTRAWSALPRASAPRLPVAYLSEPQRRTFTGVGDREVHAVVHPPRHPDHPVDPGDPPPYVVFVHGGPTSRYPPVVDPEIAFFTSRGLGVAEVDYGGTTGYGRAYRERLREGWGVVDVEDSVAVALGLVAEGSADPARLAIRGGSAGGFTSACALVAGDVFACATIRYPILDLAGWRTGETHDFESHYLEGLVGPWPEAEDRYEARSPVNHTDRISRPFLLMQGLDDLICPPVQCERLLERVAGRGIRHAYLTFEGESHGFRKEETLIASMEAELSFYGQVFGFEPPGVPRLELVT
jgi:dipeptidyl aminopeptidase/acylaminoacyl peptidase